MLEKSGIRTPLYQSLQIGDLQAPRRPKLYQQLIRKLGEGFILKPQDAAASIGVRKIVSFEEFEHYLANNQYQSLIAEQFIEGKLYHCELITQGGCTLFGQSAEYLFNGLSFINGKNHGSLPLKQDDPVNLWFIDFATTINMALGVHNGCTHHEIFITPNQQLIFLEAGLRPPGSLVPEVYKRMFKINLINIALLIDCNVPLKIRPHFTQPHFWMIFPKVNGTINKLNKPELKSRYQIKWHVKEGDELSQADSLSARAGELIAHDKDYGQLAYDFNTLRNFNGLIFETSN